MTEYQFWHGDMRLLEAYQKSYMRNISYCAWVQGQYNHIAFSVCMANSFAKKGSKQAEYPKWSDPFEKIEKSKPKITKENLEFEFRKQQLEMNDWLFNKK